MDNFYSGLADKALKDNGISREDAQGVLTASGPDLMQIFAQANQVRDHFFGNKVSVCSIINIKSGGCEEDCAFCAQSGHHETDTPQYGIMSFDPIQEYGDKVKAWKSRMGLVSSGRGVDSPEEFDAILEYTRKMAKICSVDASLGIISQDKAMALKTSGLSIYHHNVETSKKYFPNIVSTHSYDERIETIRNVRKAGLKLCCGGIMGMGEALEDRVDFAFEIRKINPDSVPLNFLNPIAGTRLECVTPIQPLEALRAIAMFRLVNPSKDIKICGGRAVILRDMQSFVFFAGASGIMIGDYLTTKGRAVDDDLAMIQDLGFEIADNGC
ncbi:MAG: biotin synthase BioB [Candidatus Raymondbacteria bacterium RifOxyA12_full_50_37]|uniref:Biotin synthase n=1 Tax=Candidatus Raymondbacteria bacterium RIFOXYD12_FULL_49_13 TaxID=1817890 RepID=A0A1F7F001_UNCRA|nr:MAG: biotin synthase BioB [Candidatus Raymondbacteria bacterium RifOxyA12_full_50_37]OGJ93058.1 MAG: biotin synthase BioB [Candidatus Raymondbacteria bacterium RIFOXYA2_FULL_49_16]OGJ93610.1 MAG: biotin synthase BioB [Candidatus Raymondbacteria bacterium RifOxyB12_full_50_8]OGJ99970.1 MAG: biotin synthase BioB [Candidatus Raymondbacteria bacterium RIFOXYD12_FULL_49_13]OGK01583.1 MAG: biotin synthase BioB [Candidatus Raymondbacteria bacterium RifOxyC12_full_50_8]OGP40853.1 MAG: biotin syntha